MASSNAHEMVFSFSDISKQPSDCELYNAVMSSLQKRDADLPQKIDLIQKTDGCFTMRLQPQYKGIERAGLFFDISECLLNLKHSGDWSISRYDVIPGVISLRISDLPTWIPNQRLFDEIGRFGEVESMLLEGWLPPKGVAKSQIQNGNRVLKLYAVKQIPQNLVIDGILVRVRYVESPPPVKGET